MCPHWGNSPLVHFRLLLPCYVLPPGQGLTCPGWFLFNSLTSVLLCVPCLFSLFSSCLWPGSTGKRPRHQSMRLIHRIRISNDFWFWGIQEPLEYSLHGSGSLLRCPSLIQLWSQFDCEDAVRLNSGVYDQTWGIAKDKQGLETWLLVQTSSLFSPFTGIFMASEFGGGLFVCSFVCFFSFAFCL